MLNKINLDRRNKMKKMRPEDLRKRLLSKRRKRMRLSTSYLKLKELQHLPNLKRKSTKLMLRPRL